MKQNFFLCKIFSNLFHTAKYSHYFPYSKSRGRNLTKECKFQVLLWKKIKDSFFKISFSLKKNACRIWRNFNENLKFLRLISEKCIKRWMYKQKNKNIVFLYVYPRLSKVNNWGSHVKEPTYKKEITVNIQLIINASENRTILS